MRQHGLSPRLSRHTPGHKRSEIWRDRGIGNRVCPPLATVTLLLAGAAARVAPTCGRLARRNGRSGGSGRPRLVPPAPSVAFHDAHPASPAQQGGEVRGSTGDASLSARVCGSPAPSAAGVRDSAADAAHDCDGPYGWVCARSANRRPRRSPRARAQRPVPDRTRTAVSCRTPPSPSIEPASQRAGGPAGIGDRLVVPGRIDLAAFYATCCEMSV